jgi:pyrimidine-nucleoside phosphorylase
MQFTATEIIARKQRGESLTRREIDWFVKASTTGEVPDYQLSAFLMSVFFRGMTVSETRDLTAAMIASGRVLRLKSIRAIKVDKHSTGGVGDKISLILGPLVASVGVHVPMISGRALGHTGGTLDKLESIPGFRTALNPASFEAVVKKVGICISGQTAQIAPADRKFYAMRDVTSTIVCPPLIVSSILSKKIASGADAVVFDIKCGEGAFMKTSRQASSLAGLLERVGGMLGIKTSAVLTSMDEPLGCCVGNAIEVREAIEVLKGKLVEDLVKVSLALGSEMLILAGKAKTGQEAQTLLRSALLGGKALQKFRELVKAQGGDPGIVDEPRRLPLAKHNLTVKAGSAGYICDIDALEVGKTATLLGAGRLKKTDAIDHSVGIEFLKKRGDAVKMGEVIALVYASSPTLGRRCAGLLKEAIQVLPRRPRPKPLVLGRVRRRGSGA